METPDPPNDTTGNGFKTGRNLTPLLTQGTLNPLPENIYTPQNQHSLLNKKGGWEAFSGWSPAYFHGLCLFISMHRKTDQLNEDNNRLSAMKTTHPRWFCYKGDHTTQLYGDYDKLGGGNSNIFGIFTPNLGEDEPILTHIFQMGWFNHKLVNHYKDPYQTTRMTHGKYSRGPFWIRQELSVRLALAKGKERGSKGRRGADLGMTYN